MVAKSWSWTKHTVHILEIGHTSDTCRLVKQHEKAQQHTNLDGYPGGSEVKYSDLNAIRIGFTGL